MVMVVTRLLTDLALAQAEKQSVRFYAMSGIRLIANIITRYWANPEKGDSISAIAWCGF